MERVQLCGLIVILFSGLVHSWGTNSYRGGTISYRPNSFFSNRVEISYRLAFELSYVYCNSGNTGYGVTWTYGGSRAWGVEMFSYYGGSYYQSISYSNKMYCRDFNIEEGWSEGNNSFILSSRPTTSAFLAKTYNYAHWIRNVSKVDGYGSMLLSATANASSAGFFNNSSPVSSLPLTVYVVQGIPSVIKIPVQDPDGDIVRCRNASYQECYRGMCTYFPYGVLDEGSCTLRYNGGGSAGQLFPIILKLEDFPTGTTQFDSSNSLGSVDLQFVVHIMNAVRIQGGGSSGRLQVLHNGVWGTVCDDGWTMTNTHVVCRQLGFGGALSYYNSGGGTGPIWLDEVRCYGYETAIQQCRHNRWGNHDCGHGEDVFVTCLPLECSNYTVLNTSDRAANYRGITNKCDYYDITPGWYRFMGDAGTTIATSCVDMYHCGTRSPGWMNSSHPTQEEGVVTRTVCYSNYYGCCDSTNNIFVRNCGGFYVYQLVKPRGCNLRYCGSGIGNNTCASSPCRNNGTCRDSSSGYRCYCPSGYSGTQCETSLYPCTSNPCGNGGSCRGGYGWYTCDCPIGYTGRQCETGPYPCINKTSCHNGGTCHGGYGWYYCSCRSSYTGRQCQTHLYSCNSGPCLNNGTCQNVGDTYNCSCPSGYTGQQCQHAVRIQGGGSSGRLQVLNGTWGTVCDDGWTMTNTHVVCRQLGFAGGVSYYSSGGGTGPIWLDDVRCYGYETAIQQCRHNGWGSHNCGHGEDVHVRCLPIECSNYNVLNTADRAANYRGITNKCDRYITPGWYRFMGDAGTTIATSCVDMYHCGTSVPGWMVGSHPTQADGVVTRRVCYSYHYGTCCSRHNNIRVRNCGRFYVYELVKPQNCNFRYCGSGMGNNTCASRPCRNNGTCVITYYGYRCYCPYGYSGTQCETSMYSCHSNPCRNGGTCRGGYGWYRCDCPGGYTGRQCETAANDPCSCLNGGTCRYSWYAGYRCECPSGYTGKICEKSFRTNVTCDESYMQIDLEDKYFPDIDWRNLHLKDSSCRATKTPDTSRLRTPLNRCGTTYTETQKTITFWNEIKIDNRYQPAGNGSSISRNRHLNLRFFCSYERSRFVSTSFSPSKKTVVASEGSYGNFTFTMDLYQSSKYSAPYSPFAYPVAVYPNQPLWVQYEVKNTNADLVVFAENCRATTSTDPDSFPQHVFLERGCVRDRSMSYWYNPYSNVQQFSIRSFRFVYSNTFLVYLHCELLVCHRNTNNSRCAQGCISGSRRRRETDDKDGSNLYDLSAGPLKGGEINAKGENQEGSSTSEQLIGGLGAVGGVFFVITILLSVIVYRNRRRGQDNKPTSIALDVTVNSYEQDNVDSDENKDSAL